MARINNIIAALILAYTAAAAPSPSGSSSSVASTDNTFTIMSETVRTLVANPNTPEAIANSYVVVYNSDFDIAAIDAKEASFTAAVRKRNIGKRSLEGRALSTSVRSLSLSGWRASILDADDDLIQEINASDEVAYVEINAAVHVSEFIAQTNAPPGLVRMSHDNANESDYIFDDSAGEGIVVYVIDTGIQASHVDFEGRATFGANFIDDIDTDDNGHGTHVSGTVAGATFGVAKKAEVVGVKVLNGQGAGSNTAVLDGMQFVINDVESRGASGRAVMNMSLGGGRSDAINRAIDALVEAGVVCVTAAGNENQDAQNVSPASANQAITVGAFDPRDDVRAEFSNFGEAVDIYGPGVDIDSCGIGADDAVATLSGTSMASPHIAGLAAYVMTLMNIQDPAQVADVLTGLADRSGADVINNVDNTANLIANNGNV